MAFNKKVGTLLGENDFIKKALQVTSEVLSEEGAKKYSTTGDPFVDNFASIALFKEPRSFAEVSKDMDRLWSINPKLCLKLAVYVRLITRNSKVVLEGKTLILENQKGQGLKNEGIMRFLWLAVNQKKYFEANIPYFIAAGSWNDIFEMMSLDLQYHGWKDKKLNWYYLYNVIKAGLFNPETSHLVRKYMPTIKSNKKCTTIESQARTLIGRFIARRMFSEVDRDASFAAYRRVKREGIAHKWQQQISQELYNDIDFNTIAGRALSLLVGSKFLENHNLIDSYRSWIEGKKTVNCTSFVFEIFKPLGHDYFAEHTADYIEATINSQFAKLVENGGVNSGLLVVRDTSSSMTSKATGCNMSSYDISKAMALYFSEFLTGTFAGCFAEFADTCQLHKWEGTTVCDKWVNDNCESYGGTNFQSVIDLFIRLKQEGVQDFPNGILCLSDGEFSNRSTGDETNFQTAINRLREAGFDKEFVDNFKIILWDIPNNFYSTKTSIKFESFADSPNFFYLSGFDGSIISFILEGKNPANARELFDTAMNQELLNMLYVPKNRINSKRNTRHFKTNKCH